MSFSQPLFRARYSTHSDRFSDFASCWSQADVFLTTPSSTEALRDTPSGHVGLSARQESGGRISLTVTDNGPGIAPDQREKVFVPFYTTKRQGSGVGLSLVRQIAAVHNGSVMIGDAKGGGVAEAYKLFGEGK